MRRGFRSLRGRSMARRPGGEGAFLDLSPRALRIGGWIVAFLLIAGIAVVIGLLGGDGADVALQPSASAGTPATASISFGTALDALSGEVAADARTDRFAAGDSFNYSVTPSDEVPAEVFVEVRRTGGGAVEIAQEPVDGQRLPNPAVIAFTVPADDLLAVFGPGEYLMLIYTDPEQEPLAEGTFHLVGPTESGAPSASASP
ncbi:MAG: hypothetical protein ACRDFY_00500 [Candidatus Limnocylindria bacterium]